MNCREAQHAMDQQMADLQLSGAIREEMQIHLMSCMDCADRYAELREVDDFIASNASVPESNPFLWTRIAARLEETPQLAKPGWAGLLVRLPLLACTWTRQRQLAASLCLLVLFVSVFFINQQSLYFEKAQLLGQIDERAMQLAEAAGNENPFPSDLNRIDVGSDNPFPAMPEIKLDKNPFEEIKSKKATRG